MSSPEGVTILAGAVFDDVFGIVTLAIVMGMAKVSMGGGEVNWAEIGIIAAKAIGFFVVVTSLGLVFARKITAAIKKFKSTEIIVATCFGLALLLAGLAEMAGLAMIIGAYIMDSRFRAPTSPTRSSITCKASTTFSSPSFSASWA